MDKGRHYSQGVPFIRLSLVLSYRTVGYTALAALCIIFLIIMLSLKLIPTWPDKNY